MLRLPFMLYFLTAMCCHIKLCAQSDSAAAVYKKLRDSYIIDLTYKINITPFIMGSGNGFELRSTKNIRVRPNEYGTIGLRVSHRWISVALAFGIKNLQSEKKGTTEFFNINVNTYRQKWGFDGYYHSYKGQYISNDDIANLPQFKNTQTYPILPSVRTVYIGTSAYYVSNHQKFSYRASFMNNELQKKSAGSFLLMASYAFFKLNSDTGFVPGDVQSSVPISSQITDGKFNSFSIMPGYAYTLVFAKKYFFTLAPSVGLMTQFQNYTTNGIMEKGKNDGNVIYPRAMARAALGYNASKWYWGISAIVDNYIIRLPQNDLLIYNIGNANVYVGFRLNVPKRFRKFSKKINEYAPENILNELVH
jgi:hypothetical protein